MIIVLNDVNGKNVEIKADQIGSILDMAYYGEYEGEDRIEDFIDWFNNDCPDFDEDDFDE